MTDGLLLQKKFFGLKHLKGILLLGFLVIIIFFFSFHNHHSSKIFQQDDCPICIVVNHIPFAYFYFFEFIIILLTSFCVLSQSLYFTLKNIAFNFVIRAPPIS